MLNISTVKVLVCLRGFKFPMLVGFGLSPPLPNPCSLSPEKLSLVEVGMGVGVGVTVAAGTLVGVGVGSHT